MGSARAAFVEKHPNGDGWSRGDILEMLSLTAQTLSVLLSGVCAFFLGNVFGTREAVGAGLTFCVVASMGYAGRGAVLELLIVVLQRYPRRAAVYVLLTTTGLVTIGVHAGIKDALGVAMLCGLSAPVVYACRILLQERKAAKMPQEDSHKTGANDLDLGLTKPLEEGDLHDDGEADEEERRLAAEIAAMEAELEEDAHEEERRLAAEIAAMEAEERESEDADLGDGQKQESTANPLANHGADSGRLSYTTSRGTDGIVE